MQRKKQEFHTQQDKMNVERKMIDDKKTAAEHEAIILKYLQTRKLDRDDAIKKYNDFNVAHKEYYENMLITVGFSGTAMPINTLPDNIIVSNLQAQLFYLTEKNVSEEINNG